MLCGRGAADPDAQPAAFDGLRAAEGGNPDVDSAKWLGHDYEVFASVYLSSDEGGVRRTGQKLGELIAAASA